MGTRLWIAVPDGNCRLVLRRLRLTDEDGHGCDASAVAEERATVSPRRPDGTLLVPREGPLPVRVPHDDPRWPAHCASCGRAFTETPADLRQVNELDWYEGDGGRFCWGIGSWDGPPGAMIRVPWRDMDGRPDAWMIFLPNGRHWCTNDPSSVPGSNTVGPQWTVTGTAPLLTVTPSIDDRGSRPWHGFIRDGELVDA